LKGDPLSVTQTLEIHPSDVNAALLCPVRLIPDVGAFETPSYDLVRGTVTHGLISFNLMGVETDAMTLAEAELATMNIEPGEFEFATKLKVLAAEAAFASACWQAQVKPQLALGDEMIVEVEHRDIIGTRHLNGIEYQVELVGTPDLIDEIGAVHDWKTARRAWELNKVPGQQQPPLYTHLAHHAPAPFVFWVFDFSKGVWDMMEPVVPTFAQMSASLDMAVDIAIARELECLVANPGQPPAYKTQTRNWWCSPKYCHRWNQCSHKHLVNDGGADVIADWRIDWQQ